MSKLMSRSARNPLHDVLLFGGGLLLVLGFISYFQAEFLAAFSVSFSETERMLLVTIGASLLALEQKTEKKIQEHAVLVAGAFGVAVGTSALMVHLGLIADILGVTNMSSPLNGLLYMALGMWALASTVISEMQFRK